MKTVIITGGVIIVLAAITFGVWKAAGGQKANTTTTPLYTISDTDRPRIALAQNESTKDIGTMKVSEKRSAVFTIQNSGTKQLDIIYGTTSCGCTFGQVRTKTQKSPLFGMHTNQNFTVSLQPKEKAEIEVIYEPYIMPVYGAVQRTATLKTNDPEHPEISFNVNAFVE